MSDKVVLPKFNLPGDRTHPAVKLVWGVGGVLLLCLSGLGAVIWSRHSQQLAAERHQEAIVAARLAEANAAAEASKARVAEAAARVALEQAKLAAAKNPPPAAPLAAVATTDASKSAAGGGHHGHHHGSSKVAGKTVAKAGPADDKKSAPKSPGEKRDDAAIDKLLASFNKK